MSTLIKQKDGTFKKAAGIYVPDEDNSISALAAQVASLQEEITALKAGGTNSSIYDSGWIQLASSNVKLSTTGSILGNSSPAWISSSSGSYAYRRTNNVVEFHGLLPIAVRQQNDSQIEAADNFMADTDDYGSNIYLNLWGLPSQSTQNNVKNYHYAKPIVCMVNYENDNNHSEPCYAFFDYAFGFKFTESFTKQVVSIARDSSYKSVTAYISIYFSYITDTAIPSNT